jgi:hypothetical protein
MSTPGLALAATPGAVPFLGAPLIDAPSPREARLGLTGVDRRAPA